MSSAGSFLDGGGSKPLQRAAIDLLTPEIVQAESAAIQRAFNPKREMVLKLGQEKAALDWVTVKRKEVPVESQSDATGSQAAA